jgi:hypothetical protein
MASELQGKIIAILGTDLVVVDESSMMDVILVSKLVKAIPPGAPRPPSPKKARPLLMPASRAAAGTLR